MMVHHHVRAHCRTQPQKADLGLMLVSLQAQLPALNLSKCMSSACMRKMHLVDVDVKTRDEL